MRGSESTYSCMEPTPYGPSRIRVRAVWAASRLPCPAGTPRTPACTGCRRESRTGAARPPSACRPPAGTAPARRRSSAGTCSSSSTDICCPPITSPSRRTGSASSSESCTATASGLLDALCRHLPLDPVSRTGSAVILCYTRRRESRHGHHTDSQQPAAGRRASAISRMISFPRSPQRLIDRHANGCAYASADLQHP